MANSIIASIFGKSGTSFTNENTGTPCWTTAKTATVEIINDSDNSDNPISDEQVNESSVYTQLAAADIETAKILRPARLRVTMFTDNLSLIENVLSLYYDTTVTLSVSSKGIVASQMAISEVEIEQTPEMLSAAKVVVILEQVLFPVSSTFAPEQPGDQSSYGINVVNPVTVGPNLLPAGSAVSSLLNNATSSVTTLYNRVVGIFGS